MTNLNESRVIEGVCLKGVSFCPIRSQSDPRLVRHDSSPHHIDSAMSPPTPLIVQKSEGYRAMCGKWEEGASWRSFAVVLRMPAVSKKVMESKQHGSLTSSDSSLLSSSPPTWFALPLPIPLAVAAAEDDGSMIPLAPWVSPAVVSLPLADALERSPRDPNNLCALAFSSFGCGVF